MTISCITDNHVPETAQGFYDTDRSIEYGGALVDSSEDGKRA